MEPTLLPGDRLYLERPRKGSPPYRKGEVVVVTDPETSGRWLIKRIGASEGERPDPGTEAVHAGYVYLVGDNPARSRDSRAFGPVPIRSVVGRVRVRYWPSARRGSIADA